MSDLQVVKDVQGHMLGGRKKEKRKARRPALGDLQKITSSEEKKGGGKLRRGTTRRRSYSMGGKVLPLKKDSLSAI